MGTVQGDRDLYGITASAVPLNLVYGTGLRRSCRSREIGSHRVYDGSEQWGDVPEPRIPCEHDASGLGIPDASEISGYVYWHQGEQGPRTALQTYADSIRQLTLAVHPLNAADCAPPSVAEVDYLRRRRATKLLLQQKTPAKLTLSLGSVLARARTVLLAFVSIWQLKRLQAKPLQAAFPIAVGIAAGVFVSACNRNWRRDRLRAAAGLHTVTDDWVHFLQHLLSQTSTHKQALNLAALSRGTETCEGVNTTIRKLWRFLDPHASRFITKRINLILSNYKPPVFLSLKLESLQLGARAPEIVSMHTFSATPRSIVLHAQLRLVGDGLYAVLAGSVPTGQVKAAVRNMRLSALTRIELMEPMTRPPFFKAISISFLEPLEPAFAIKLDAGLLTDAVAASAVKPALMHILTNEVFARLFVWPNRLVIPMRSRENPLIKPILPSIQPHIKGILAVIVKRGAGLPIEPEHKSVAALSPDGLHWYKTGKAYDGPNPVWESTGDVQAGDLGKHLLLIPLKELDVGLQVAIGLSDINAHYKWRDRENSKIVARTTVNLHSLAEGEVLEGWHKLRPREARGQDGMCLAADERHGWAPPWKAAARHAGSKRPRRLRSEFDNFQRAFCTALGEPLPPIPRRRKASNLCSYPLPDVTKMAGPGGTVLLSSDSGEEGDSGVPLQWGRRSMAAVRARSRARRHTPARPARSVRLHHRTRGSEAAGSGGAAGESADAGRVAGRAGRGAASMPWGGIYLKMVLLEAKTLKSLFNASREACSVRAVPEAATAALVDVLRPWQGAASGEGQLGCLFVTVLEAHGLSLWDESSGFEAPAYSLGLPVSYDTFVKLKLTSGEGPAREVHEEARTGTITGSREPVFLRQFEFLAQPAQRTLEVAVVNTAYVGRGRIQDKTIGVTSLRPCDLAQCPGGQVWRAPLDITAPGHPCVVTGRVMLTLDWLPLSPAPCAPPSPPPRLRLLGRGSLSVRVICAWDLAPMDVQAMTCNARVCMLAAGEERRTPTHASMCPVWLTTERFEHISECGTLWLEVQHVTQFGSQSISRCRISIEDLAPMPNQAVLVTKCLQGWDGDPTHPQRSDLHWTAGLGAPAPGDGAATEGAAGSPPRASAMSPGTPGRSESEASAWRSQGRRSGVFDVWGACDMHGPSALRWAAQQSAEASGSLASDSAPPPGTAPSGWLMFEVAFCPYADGSCAPEHGRMFAFPRVKREMLGAEARSMHAARQAKLQSALPDTHAPLLAPVLGARKKPIVVGEAGNCLRVEVLRGEGMPRTDVLGRSDPYVVLTAQSEAGLQMFRTKTAWNTLNPAWHACMDVWEAHSTGGVLEVQVWDDDVLRRDDHIATELVHVAATLRAPGPPGRRNRSATQSCLAVAPEPCPMHSLDLNEALPCREVVSREVVLELRGARHRRGVPAVHLRLTWVPAGVAAPWGGAREGRPMRPWRHTDLHALHALVGGDDSVPAESHGDADSVPTVSSPTATSAAAARARRGRLSVVVEEVQGGAGASRLPKYVTVRLNRARVGKTRSQLGCLYHHALSPMDNVSADDILVFKFKARGLQGMLLGQATQAVRELVPEPDQERLGVPFRVPLSGSHLALTIRFSWEPVRAYHLSPRAAARYQPA